jgi:hypothetical protein
MLRLAAAVECGSLAVLLVNLATAHLPVITSLGGPAHGLAYLVVVVATLRDPAATRTAKVLAWLPGIGGLLVTRQLRTVTPGGPGLGRAARGRRRRVRVTSAAESGPGGPETVARAAGQPADVNVDEIVIHPAAPACEPLRPLPPAGAPRAGSGGRTRPAGR